MNFLAFDLYSLIDRDFRITTCFRKTSPKSGISFQSSLIWEVLIFSSAVWLTEGNKAHHLQVGKSHHTEVCGCKLEGSESDFCSAHYSGFCIVELIINSLQGECFHIKQTSITQNIKQTRDIFHQHTSKMLLEVVIYCLHHYFYPQSKPFCKYGNIKALAILAESKKTLPLFK